MSLARSPNGSFLKDSQNICNLNRNLFNYTIKHSANSSLILTKRWSDIVPPDTGLTFAAIWDPSDGLVSFSGAELLMLESPTICDTSRSENIFKGMGATDAPDNVSQVLTIDRLAMQLQGRDVLGLPYSEPNTAMLPPDNVANPTSFTREARFDLGDMTPTCTCFPTLLQACDTSQRTSADASTTLHNFGAKPIIDASHIVEEERAMHEEMGTDEGYYELSYTPSHQKTRMGAMDEYNPKSAFTMTTTSTSRYVHVNSALYSCTIPDVERAPFASSSWSTIEAPFEIIPDPPYTPETARPDHTSHCPRKLHKKRPTPRRSSMSSSPITYVSQASPGYVNDDTDTVTKNTGTVCSKLKLGLNSTISRRNRLSFPLQSCRKSSVREEDMWVIVDVTQVVNQRLVEVL